VTTVESPEERRLQEDRVAALTQRLTAVAPYLDGSLDADGLVADRGVGPLLDALVRAVADSLDDRRLWILLVATTGAFPLAEHVRAARRALAVSAIEHRFSAYLRAASELAVRSDGIPSHLEVVSGGVVADVDFCARHLHNTGIQRVVRQTVSRWSDRSALTLVGWSDRGAAMRTLSAQEKRRVVDWNAAKHEKPEPVSDAPATIVLPVDSTVAVVEVPRAELCGPLAALAEFSGNRVLAIGYDAIPVVSADTVPAAETERFVQYLSFIKHADTVAAISESVREEFAGFASSVTPQGLAGPRSIAISLPVDAPDARPAAPTAHDSSPLVLCVGSQEPRKNHDAVLYAAEVLWREGVDFRLRFIGRGSLWFTKGFDKRIAALAKNGRDVAVLRGIDDEQMLAMYREARFTVFPSLQEGYGLPVAESIAERTPVITTAYGSTGEIARDGGCLTIDPRDDESIVTAMRRLLTDDGAVAALIDEIDRRPRRTWDDYASELWSTFELVEEDAR
jgi:glycosyltransferase involved in cell wall biosynthesis